MQDPSKEENPQTNSDPLEDEGASRHANRGKGAPEPPSSWRPTAGKLQQSNHREEPSLGYQAPYANTSNASSSGAYRNPPEYERIRKLISISQICAVISLFIGGVALSVAALVIGIMGYRTLSQAVKTNSLEVNYARPLRQSCIIALIMSACALAVNVAALVYVYPLLMHALETGDYSTLLGGGVQPGTSSGSGTTTWG